MGTTVENVLEEAKYIDLRYKRILLEGDILLKQGELYPELRGVSGSFKVEIIPVQSLTNENMQKSLYEIDYGSGSNTHGIFYDNYYGFKPHKLSQLVGTLSEKSIIFKVVATNITEQSVKKDWTKNSPSVVTFTDDRGHQYTNYGELFASKSFESLLTGEAKIHPGTTISMIYAFDKIEGYNPKILTVYFNGEETGKKIAYKQPDVGKKLKENSYSINGKDRFETNKWSAKITHYTPKVYQATQQDYGFGLQIKLANLSGRKLERPSIDTYAIGPEGHQCEGYCSGGSYEVGPRANTTLFCTFYVKPNNFNPGDHDFTVEINTGTIFEPNIHKLGRNFKISSLQ